MRNVTLEELNITKAKQNQFKTKGIENAEDLLHFLPRKVNRIPIFQHVPHDVENYELIGVVVRLTGIVHTSKTIRLEFDLNGQIVLVVLFNSSHVVKSLEVGVSYYVVGKCELSRFFGQTPTFTMPKLLERHFEFSKVKDVLTEYSSIKGMSRDYLEGKIRAAIDMIPNMEELPMDFVNKHGLISKKTAYQNIHFPISMQEYETGLKRHTYEIVYLQAKGIVEVELENRTDTLFIPTKNELVTKIKENLPFKLTEGQEEVLMKYDEEARKGNRINSLLQGDVGSGKTITSTLFMASMVDSGYQAAMLAPTSVLAEQHFNDIKKMLEPYGVRVEFLNGAIATKKRMKNKILKELAEGEIDILVGTHAILQDDVIFKELGVAMVDEEHRFGVVHREKLSKQSLNGIHIVRMSATPIPRSLALTMYSSTISIDSIKTMPIGRKPVKTAFLSDSNRIFNGIKMQIENNNQVYVVCPLIEESEAESMTGIESVEEAFERYSRLFSGYDKAKIGMLSGKMKAEEVTDVLGKFTNNEINILISTTVIEVGVNVPNSTMIVIQNAERFGLAQLHQLRGRVGRSTIQSYCIMTSPKGLTPRIQAMNSTTDGFKIAEIDLELRGAGDLIGTKQSGKTEYMNVIEENLDLFEEVRNTIMENHKIQKTHS